MSTAMHVFRQRRVVLSMISSKCESAPSITIDNCRATASATRQRLPPPHKHWSDVLALIRLPELQSHLANESCASVIITFV